jgi:hypothetical protein
MGRRRSCACLLQYYDGSTQAGVNNAQPEWPGQENREAWSGGAHRVI